MIWSGLELSKLTGDGAYLEPGASRPRRRSPPTCRPGRRLRRPSGGERHRRAARRGDVRARDRGRRRRSRARGSSTNAAAAPRRATAGRLLRPLLRRPAAACDGDRLADERRARARDRGGGARPARRRSGPVTGGQPRAGSPRSLGPAGVIRFTGSGDRPSRDARRGLLRGRPRARASWTARETFDGTGIWQNKSSLGRRFRGRCSSPGAGPLRGGTRSASRPGSRTGRRAGRFSTFRAT